MISREPTIVGAKKWNVIQPFIGHDNTKPGVVIKTASRVIVTLAVLRLSTDCFRQIIVSLTDEGVALFCVGRELSDVWGLSQDEKTDVLRHLSSCGRRQGNATSRCTSEPAIRDPNGRDERQL